MSHFVDGGVAEILPGGQERRIVEPGMVGPWGLAVAADGTLYAADGLSLIRRRPDGGVDRPGNLLLHGFPGFARDVALGPDGTFYLANPGGVAFYTVGEDARFLANRLDNVMGIAVQADGHSRQRAIVCRVVSISGWCPPTQPSQSVARSIPLS